MLGLAALALRYPRIFGFLRRFGKWIALALLIVGAWWWFATWKADLIETSRREGFAQAEQQYTAAINAANERERAKQVALDQLQTSFGALAVTREQQITIATNPRIERVQREVASNPRYRECAVSGGVLDELNAARSSVNARIAASSPDAAR